jgi:hypothetical protein
MTEQFLHYLWKFRLLNNVLTTTSGEDIVILKPGDHNRDSGPDFINARIRIGTTLWAGNVEVHLKTSDWIRHKHHEDEAYQNIILHAVLESDREIYRNTGESIPTLILQGKYDAMLYERYRDLMENLNWIPCEKMIGQVDDVTICSQQSRLLVERLERKSGYIEAVYRNCMNSWDEAFYQLIARNFGFRLNAEPFELLAKSIPLQFIAKHRDNPFQVEALLFGQSGMLKKKYADEYPRHLAKEYRFLRKKYSLKPVDAHLWKFLRLRPSNFPTIRISQFSCLLCKSQGLFSEVLSSHQLKDLRDLFDLKCSEYWTSHYIFDRKSVSKVKRIGVKTVDLLLINTVIPFIFLYGMSRDNPELKERALDFLSGLPAEENSISNQWRNLRIKIDCAFSSQAMMELKEHYCDQKRCLDCKIGHAILEKEQ